MRVFPAYAGMIPDPRVHGRAFQGVPRIRGDDPFRKWKIDVDSLCSPHTRG